MGGFYQDLRKHEGAVPARVNEVLALLYGGEHLAAWAWAWAWDGKWKMENGKWKIENGKWKMENRKYPQPRR